MFSFLTVISLLETRFFASRMYCARSKYHIFDPNARRYIVQSALVTKGSNISKDESTGNIISTPPSFPNAPPPFSCTQPLTNLRNS